VTNAAQTFQTGSDRVEFIRFDRQADKGGYDFGVVGGPINHVGISYRIIGRRKFLEQDFTDRCHGAGVGRDHHIIERFPPDVNLFVHRGIP
jgi:hypothetical protein